MTKNKGGRPSKYNDETIPKTLEYLNDYEKLGDAIPSIEGLAVYLSVGVSTIYDWSTPERQEFSDTLSKILAKQAQVLLNKGLTSEFNSTITKLALHNHGYSDKKEIETIEKRKLSDFTDEELTDRLQELHDKLEGNND